MKKKGFLKIAVAIVAVMIAVCFTACGEIIYYVDKTAPDSNSGGSLSDRIGGGGTNAGTNDNNGGSGSSDSGNNGGTTDTSATTDTPDDGSTYTLRVWCAEEDVNMITKMLYAYSDLHSGNTYNWKVEKVGENVVASKVTQDVSAAADIFSFANDQIGTLMQAKALTPIPDKYKAQIEEQIYSAQLACTYNNRYYALPYSYENVFLYYNTDLLGPEDVKSMESLLGANVPTAQYKLGIDMADSYYTTMFLYTAGVTIFGDDGTDPNSVDLANEHAMKACRYIASLGDKSALGSIAKADQYAALKNGKVAAMISGPHMISQFKDALGDHFGVAVLPTIRFAGESQDTEMWSFSGVKMYGVSSKDSSKRDQKTTDEALRVAAYLSNAENQTKRLNEREFCPTNQDLFDKAVESDIDTVDVVVEQAERCKLKPGLTQMSNYWEDMASFLLGVYKFSYKESQWLGELTKIENKLK